MPRPGEETSPRTMRCLEVWGGNEAVDQGVVMPGLDAWLYSRPFEGHSAGGDLHYVSSCAAGLVTRVLVADVSGHGEMVSDTARKLRELMRRYVNYIDQTRLVRSLNEQFGQHSEAGRFATTVAATYFAPEDKLTVSNAGHPLPLWYRSRSRSWSLMGGRDGGNGANEDELVNVPLGIAEPTQYDQFDVKFRTGDMVVLYTDSLIEAKDSSGKMLGTDGLLGVAEGLDPSDPAEFMQSLLDAVGQEDIGLQSSDDVTVLILRANAMKPRPTLGVELTAHGRMLLTLLGKLRPGAPAFPWPDVGPLSRLAAFLHRLNPRWGA